MKPCPFCGDSHLEIEPGDIVTCDKCDARIFFDVWNSTPGPATRAMLDHIDARFNGRKDFRGLDVAVSGDYLTAFLAEWSDAKETP